MNKQAFKEGIRDGIPIGLGYFAVSFSLGIMAKLAGLDPVMGFISSFVNSASAGQYALYTAIAGASTIAELALATLIINARYLLMSCALSQKFDPKEKMIHRLLIGFWVTDELFGISIARKGKITPAYNYGAILVASPLWCLGTALGIIAGNILPASLVSALSVALYGMFIAIVIPPARKNATIAVMVSVSFILSYAATKIPGICSLSDGSRTILLTVMIATVFAIIKPVKDEENMEVKENV